MTIWMKCLQFGRYQRPRTAADAKHIEMDATDLAILLAGIRQRPDEQGWKFYVQHDRDSKFSAAFNRVITSARGKFVKTPVRAPNLQAFVERLYQTLRREVLNHFLNFGQKHLDFLTETFVPFYHSRRPHQGKENQVLPLDPEPVRGKS